MNADEITFVGVFNELLPARMASDYKGPSSLLDGWDSIVRQCEDGYTFGLSEFSNDLWVRNFIDRLCADPRVIGDPVRIDFMTVLEDTDRRFRSMLAPEFQIGQSDMPWWQRGVLRYAEEEYVEDLRNQYGIAIDTVGQ